MLDRLSPVSPFLRRASITSSVDSASGELQDLDFSPEAEAAESLCRHLVRGPDDSIFRYGLERPFCTMRHQPGGFECCELDTSDEDDRRALLICLIMMLHRPHDDVTRDTAGYLAEMAAFAMQAGIHPELEVPLCLTDLSAAELAGVRRLAREMRWNRGERETLRPDWTNTRTGVSSLEIQIAGDADGDDFVDVCDTLEELQAANGVLLTVDRAVLSRVLSSVAWTGRSHVSLMVRHSGTWTSPRSRRDSLLVVLEHMRSFVPVVASSTTQFFVCADAGANGVPIPPVAANADVVAAFVFLFCRCAEDMRHVALAASASFFTRMDANHRARLVASLRDHFIEEGMELVVETDPHLSLTVTVVDTRVLNLRYRHEEGSLRIRASHREAAP